MADDEPGRNQRVTNAVLAVKLDAVIAKLDEQAAWQREDHDSLTRHNEQITSLFRRVEQVDKARKLESRIIGAIDGFAAIAAYFAGRISV